MFICYLLSGAKDTNDQGGARQEGKRGQLRTRVIPRQGKNRPRPTQQKAIMGNNVSYQSWWTDGKRIKRESATRNHLPSDVHSRGVLSVLFFDVLSWQGSYECGAAGVQQQHPSFSPYYTEVGNETVLPTWGEGATHYDHDMTTTANSTRRHLDGKKVGLGKEGTKDQPRATRNSQRKRKQQKEKERKRVGGGSTSVAPCCDQLVTSTNDHWPHFWTTHAAAAATMRY